MKAVALRIARRASIPWRSTPAWRDRYTWFPALLVILDGAPDDALRRRVAHLEMRTQQLSRHDSGFRVGVTTMRSLQDKGPRAEIFQVLHDGYNGLLDATLVHEPQPEPAPEPEPSAEPAPEPVPEMEPDPGNRLAPLTGGGDVGLDEDSMSGTPSWTWTGTTNSRPPRPSRSPSSWWRPGGRGATKDHLRPG
ncbi:hypothetical protein [Nocardiopsis gilva]|uniref:hypothetical protein n=1 Tax=Nocardiopsis gilva TaxID=280236 RepID=UPI00034490D7|nr:hypothetical protein [Nocardiopsis gilva]